jgi:hypothetical protein
MPRVGGKNWGYVQHLGLLLRGHSRGGDMALFAAHFDKSGDKNEPLVVVAGFIASDFKWDVLGEKWKKTMHDFGIEDFHMSNFFRNGEGFPRRDWTESRKDELMKHLARLITDYTKQPIAYGVTAKAIQSAKLGTTKQYIGDQYRFACDLCIHQCTDWALDAKALRERVNFVFDNDGKFYGPVTSAYGIASQNAFLQNKWRIGNFAFSDRHCSPGIQAADMFAYLVFDYQKRYLKDKAAQQHPYLDSLLLHPISVNPGWLVDSAEYVELWGKRLQETFGNPPAGFFKGFNPRRGK